jgi:hypothetical protein
VLVASDVENLMMITTKGRENPATVFLPAL